MEQRSVHLSNSIDKLRQPLSSSSKSNSDKMRKIRSDKNSSNHIIDNSIDKNGRLLVAAKSSKLNYQNLKRSKMLLPECFPIPKVLPASSSHIDEYNYEDDFEDYSDDFEEDTETDNNKSESSDRESSTEKSNIGRSDKIVNNESYDNSPLLRRIMNHQQSDNSQPQFTHSSDLTQRKIDFTNATTINWEKISEVERRYKMLKNLIGMEIVQFDLLDHHRICAHDFYAQMFGNTNYTQVQTQTGDDDLNCYVQTEEVDKETVWTQIPYSDHQDCGVVSISNDIDYHKHFDIDDSEINFFKIGHFEMEKFRKFISIAGQVFIDIMQSSSNCTAKLSLEYRTSSFKFSTGYSKFLLGDFINSAKITSIFHWENHLFVAFYIEQTSNDDMINRNIIIEFDIYKPNIPQKILLCENEVKCLCTSPDGISAVFVGLNDGSCMAYDLREQNSLFTNKLRWHQNGEMYPLRTAAYDTSFKAFNKKAFEEDNQFAIVAISNIPSNINSSETYQIVSVNEAGIVIIWTIINEESIRINDHDLGLRPGAQLKMAQTSIIRPDRIHFSNLNSSRKMTVNCMVMVPINPAQFFLGTSRGIIINFISNKAIKLIGPRIYRNDFDLATEVICISFSLESTFFLAIGFSNGEVQLHDLAINRDNRKGNKSLSNVIKAFQLEI
ncbi:Uncharacterized protein BM_BM9855 [Brugia malayi]|uniref:Uncharacterized protein n=1 Tax=Brugia malayi TaxID=6279 RepID=A0A4E9F0Q1_BRUMA|nr:Uncharacterized protein BM_BM9855 [Brugia malayi]VIO90190.1 Uncharacterized protein BM_BM9855 [Brugia malayi]